MLRAGGLVASERDIFDLGGRAELRASTWEDVVPLREKVRHNGPGLNACGPGSNLKAFPKAFLGVGPSTAQPLI